MLPATSRLIALAADLGSIPAYSATSGRELAPRATVARARSRSGSASRATSSRGAGVRSMSPLWTTFDCRRCVLAFGLVRAPAGASTPGAIFEHGQDSPDRLCLHRVRGRQPALGRPLPNLWSLEQPDRRGAGALLPGQGIR